MDYMDIAVRERPLNLINHPLSRCQAIIWTNAGILLIGLLRNVCIMLTHWALGDAAVIFKKKYDFQTHYTE